MRYLEDESTFILANYDTGDTVTIDVYRLSDNTQVVNSASMSEIGTLGRFKYSFSQSISAKTEYLYVTTNSTNEQQGKIILGGYPDDIKNETDKIQTVDDNVDLILADTNELQGNQGNWATAVGFAVPNEYDTELTNIQTEVNGLNGEAMRGTDNANIIIPTSLAEATANKNEIITEVNGNAAKIDLIPTTPMRGTDSVPVNPLLTTDTRLNNLDAAISTRSSHSDPTTNIKGAENKDLTQVFNNEKGTDNAYTGIPPTAEEIRTELEATGTKLTNIKNQTDKLNFTGLDINATLDGEEVTTDSASREASKATGFSTHSAEQVWTTTNRELSTPDDYKADVSALADIAIDIKRMLGLSQENYKLFNPVYDSDKNLLSVTTKIYPTADDCNNDSNAIAEYAMTATYVEKQLDTYKVIRT